MRAARLHGARDVRIEDIPAPIPGPGEALIRVRAVCICPSDWRMYADGHAGGVVPERPIVQGHEFSGEVVALGPGVVAPPLGTRVAVEPSWPCGECDLCRSGRGNICRHVRFPSFPPVDGALAELIACPVSALARLPDTLTYEEGALAEPLGVSMHAVRLAAPKPTERVGILGAGIIGMGCLLLMRREGVAEIAVVEPLADRHRFPAANGANVVIGHFRELVSSGYEADIVMECSGDVAGLDQAVHLARPGGRIVIVGIPRDERITFDMSIARRRELSVVFSRRSHETIEEAVRLMATREVNLSELPLSRYGLDVTEEALRLTGEPGATLRAVVSP
ncbi:MAG: zinc-binding dehydrogenase [Armatimonadetes bacterium]|nr:zinc-binding dehydrogenase [Armatimonadota bacterium]